MNNMNESAANILSEKLALTRELANLKPELEHLRSQVNHQQSILAEKLSLERQVSTLEVELANEKKATKRALQSRQSNDRVEDELRKKLRETEKNLTAEIAERERLQDQLEQRMRTHAITMLEQENTRELEVDLRKKLQEAQRQLREEKGEKERLDEELQSAQHASEKLQQREEHSPAEAELRAQLEKMEKKFAVLQKESNKRNQEHQAAVSELEGRNEQLEKKLEKARIKLRGMQEELKMSQAELRKAQSQPVRLSGNDDNTKPTAKAQAFRKRKAQETTTSEFTNIEIQTPSADDAVKARRAMKKTVFEPTLVGEKSAFSITPFLSRSKNTSMSDEASDLDDGVLEDSILGPHSVSEPSEFAQSSIAESSTATSTFAEPATKASLETEKPQMVAKVRGRPKKVLGDAPSAKKNALAQKAAKKILKTKSSLDKVSEAAAESEQRRENTIAEAGAAAAEPAERTMTVKFNLAPSQDESNNDSSLNGEVPKKKKRKVLGSTKTLFDNDDDGEAPAPSRKPAKKQQQQPAGAKAKRTKAPLGAQQKNAFAGTVSFSPLKRDRRGVGASFLA